MRAFVREKERQTQTDRQTDIENMKLTNKSVAGQWLLLRGGGDGGAGEAG